MRIARSMSLILCAVALFIGTSAGAQNQNFAPVGATWYYSQQCSGNSPDCGYHLFEVISDTVLFGKDARLLRYFQDGQLIEDGQQILYSENNKVYFWMNSDFHLMYDFNAQEGDTLSLKMGPSFFTGGDTVGYYQVIIDSIGNTSISGNDYRTFYHRSLYDITFSGAPWRYFGEVIEKIGDLGFLFGHSVAFPLIDFLGWIRCYQDNEIYYNPSAIQCDYISGVNEAVGGGNLLAFPNPTSSILHLTLDSKAIGNISYHIYDVLGRVADTGTLNQSHIDVSNLPDGVYSLRIHNHQLKFLKNEN